ncbi:MAG: hypothetical protein HOK21_15830 [Rhodospirillaceae bacterium]|jgi:surface carbohydrate biosynthesis protein|nr:hypothetical protein [Rhodospirillaceae bacterium]MBT4688779.1 hypothetical protein [Rhodospirillaceae bacterium]MBT5083395.1 hypothetical protein [Rhodospirillaceae bacterium]MBT5525555.1 hypothetical protein [Rhodospirillaceae bacterium]MBT5880593.1 hypothetical protein [Rhodospirillaceae bacterium]
MSDLSKPRRWLLLPIETKAREFHAKTLLAAAAAERGFDVLLGDQNAILAQLAHLPVGIYVDKSIARTKVAHFQLLRDAGYVVCAWCEEGVVYRDRDTYLHQRIAPEAMAQVDRFFAWGQNQADDIAFKLPDAAGKIRAIGNPRFDLLRPEFRAIFADEAKAHQSQHGRYLLINTNFSRFNHFLGQDFWIKAQRQRGGIKTAADQAAVQHWIDFIGKIFHGFAHALPDLSRAFPDHTIILRPHPSEDHGAWGEAAAGLGNVQVLHHGNVIPWILGADCVLQNSCTTGVEAHVLGVPVAAYRPATDAVVDSHLPNLLSRNAYSPDELIETVSALMTGRMGPPDDVGDKAGHYLAAATGSLAADRIADELAALDGPKAGFAQDPLPRIGRLGTRVATALRPRIRRLVRGGRAADYANQKFPGMDVDEVRGVLAQLQSVSGRFSDVGAADLPLHHCFHISKSS